MSQTKTDNRFVRARRAAIRLVCAVVVLLLGTFVLCVSNRDVSDWVKFHILNPRYMYWKSHGGQRPAGYHNLVVQDRDRDSMVRGLTRKQILKKFPFLTEGSSYPKDSYKGECSPEFLWFEEEDGFDLCVEFENGEAHIYFVKG